MSNNPPSSCSSTPSHPPPPSSCSTSNHDDMEVSNDNSKYNGNTKKNKPYNPVPWYLRPENRLTINVRLPDTPPPPVNISSTSEFPQLHNTTTNVNNNQNT